MYRVMIVDDEQLIRITLKNMIDWKALDCMVLAMAKDGEEAWQIYQEARPEIVITDLKMPKMDGIELIRRIRGESKNTQVIALSNHSDFELVKDAMKAGAFDYLLKVTLEEEELEKVIRQVQEVCKVAGDSSDTRKGDILEKLHHQLLLIKNEHQIDMQYAEKLLEDDLFDPYRKQLQIAYFRIDNINLHYQNNSVSHESIRRNLQDIMEETIPNYLPSLLLFISNHSGLILFQNKEPLRTLNTCNSIMRNIAQYLTLQISMTLSEPCANIMQFYEIFKALLERHGICFYIGEGILIEAKDLPQFNRLQMEQVSFHKQMIEAMATRDFEKLREEHNALMMYMKQNFILPEDVINYAVFILNNMEGNELAKGIKINFNFTQVVSMVQQCETIDKLHEVLTQGYKLIELWILDVSNNRYRQDITEIIHFIEENYKQKISLKLIAEKFNINESYLSRMFKNETGKNLIYYINECKMQKAKELLSDSQMMIKEAAVAVGMDDQLYFNKVFKKFYDISPSDFRKRVMGNEES